VATDEPDLLFAHALWRDEKNQLCIEELGEVNFAVAGDAILVGPAKVCAEAGVASTLLRVPSGARSFHLTASSIAAPERTTQVSWRKGQKTSQV